MGAGRSGEQLALPACPAKASQLQLGVVPDLCSLNRDASEATPAPLHLQPAAAPVPPTLFSPCSSCCLATASVSMQRAPAHLVSRQLHARQVIALDVELAARRHAWHRPRVDGRGQKGQAVALGWDLSGQGVNEWGRVQHACKPRSGGIPKRSTVAGSSRGRRGTNRGAATHQAQLGCPGRGRVWLSLEHEGRCSRRGCTGCNTAASDATGTGGARRHLPSAAALLLALCKAWISIALSLYVTHPLRCAQQLRLSRCSSAPSRVCAWVCGGPPDLF